MMESSKLIDYLKDAFYNFSFTKKKTKKTLGKVKPNSLSAWATLVLYPYTSQ
jgi:hypothetical protein